jgi:hypothetical protein
MNNNEYLSTLCLFITIWGNQKSTSNANATFEKLYFYHPLLIEERKSLKLPFSFKTKLNKSEIPKIICIKHTLLVIYLFIFIYLFIYLSSTE